MVENSTPGQAPEQGQGTPGQAPAQAQGNPGQAPVQGHGPKGPPPSMEAEVLPGTEVIGRGVTIRPGLPYELKRHVFPPSEDEHTFHSRDTGRLYKSPVNYVVNQSPPMSMSGALGQTHIMESFEHYKEFMSIDAKASVGSAPFSVDMSVQQVSSSEVNTDRYIALRRNFIPLWEIYLPDISGSIDMEADFPAPFSRTAKEEYQKFFDRYGTHVVRRVWVGGKATLTLSINKNAGISQNDIRGGISVKSATGSGSASEEQSKQREKLLANSDITVSGEGGDKLKLGALRSLDDTSYDNWLATVCDNPKVIEMEVVGIWTLLKDQEKGKALARAYKAAVNVKPISVLSSIKEDLLLVYGKSGVLFDQNSGKVKKSDTIPNLLRGLPPEFTTVDLILDYGNVFGDVPERENKLFLFHDRMYARYDKKKGRVDEGYPKLIKGTHEDGRPLWPGLTFNRIDAAINWGDETAYFFSGSEYIRYNLSEDRADPGYPKPIHPHWSGLTFEYIDAVITWDYKSAYFFKGNEYIRYNMVRYQADPGYPKTLSSGYIEDWQLD